MLLVKKVYVLVQEELGWKQITYRYCQFSAIKMKLIAIIYTRYHQDIGVKPKVQLNWKQKKTELRSQE